jgi:thymidine kinase
MLPKGRDGMIDLVLGPMFAGKSTELLRRIKRYRVASKKCMVIKYAKDVRYSDKCVSTHDQQMIEAVSCENLFDIQDKALDYDIIGIDEGQFFEGIVEFSEAMANLGKMIIIAALDGTFERKAFGRVLELIPLAESVTKLDAVCVDCKQSASFTKRLVESKETELIGGADIYKPVCRGCFNKDKESSSVLTEKKELKENFNSSNIITQDFDEDKENVVLSKPKTLKTLGTEGLQAPTTLTQ